MNVLEANAGLLSNYEVRELLCKRGADKGPVVGLITSGECKVYEYLLETAAGTQTRADIAAFVSGVKGFSLTDAEKLQSINLRPSSAVEVHLIVEDCDERLSSSQVMSFIDTTTETLPAPPVKPEAEGEEEEPDEANHEGEDETEQAPENGATPE